MLDPGKEVEGRDQDLSHFGQFLGSLDGFASFEFYHGIAFKSNVEIANDGDESFGRVQFGLLVQVFEMGGELCDLIELKAEKMDVNKSERFVII